VVRGGDRSFFARTPRCFGHDVIEGAPKGELLDGCRALFKRRFARLSRAYQRRRRRALECCNVQSEDVERKRELSIRLY
jgi:hypothetical protein